MEFQFASSTAKEKSKQTITLTQALSAQQQKKNPEAIQKANNYPHTKTDCSSQGEQFQDYFN